MSALAGASTAVRQRTDMSSRSTLRASDADREHVADRLRHAAAEGRLLAEELEQRLGAAFKAKTYGELDAVVSDLPHGAVARRQSRSSASVARPVMLVAFALVALAVIAAVALVITGVLAAWGLWALIAWWAFGGRCHHRRRTMRHGRHHRHWQGHAVG